MKLIKKENPQMTDEQDRLRHRKEKEPRPGPPAVDAGTGGIGVMPMSAGRLCTIHAQGLSDLCPTWDIHDAYHLGIPA